MYDRKMNYIVEKSNNANELSRNGFDPTKVGSFKEFLTKYQEKKSIIMDFLHRGNIRISGLCIPDLKDLSDKKVLHYIQNQDVSITFENGNKDWAVDTWTVIYANQLFNAKYRYNLSRSFTDDDVIEILSIAPDKHPGQNIAPVLRYDNKKLSGYNATRGGWIRQGSEFLTPKVGKDGYLYVNISRALGKPYDGPVFIHRIIAETFIPHLPEETRVIHIDGNKYNNSVRNLRWVTPAEVPGNYTRGASSATSKYSDQQIAEVDRLLKAGKTVKEVVNITGVKSGVVYQVRNHKIRPELIG